MSSSTWQDHFKEQLVGLEPPREGSFLEMALSEGRITEKDYLQWASETHSIPMVSPQFFIEMQPDPALLEKASLPWRSTFFPVAEWDGHLIVAGLEQVDAFVEALKSVVIRLRQISKETEGVCRA
jgi:hypothetical protein